MSNLTNEKDKVVTIEETHKEILKEKDDSVAYVSMVDVDIAPDFDNVHGASDHAQVTQFDKDGNPIGAVYVPHQMEEKPDPDDIYDAKEELKQMKRDMIAEAREERRRLVPAWVPPVATEKAEHEKKAASHDEPLMQR